MISIQVLEVEGSGRGRASGEKVCARCTVKNLCRRNDKGVPPGKMKEILYKPCFSNQIGGYGERLPGKQIFDIFAGVGYLHSRLQLSRDNRVKFGKDLQ